MEENNIGFEDFESALFADDYQTDSEDGVETTETTDEPAQEADSDDENNADGGEDKEDEPADEPEKDGSEGEEKPDGSSADQTFTIKVNKEERQVSLEEMTTLAQKGADYDRVKDQYTKGQQTIQELQSKLDGMTAQQGVLDILGIIAEKSGSSLDKLAESLYVNFRKTNGVSEEVAREELKNAKLEKELNGYKAQQTQQKEKETDAEARAKKDLEDFRKEYPDVELTQELIGKLTSDISGGMSLTASYRKYEKAQDAARIQELERKLAAERQNNKNKHRSPGSQQDSGGRRTKSDYEEFEKALFG